MMKKIKYIILFLSIIITQKSFSQSCTANFSYTIDTLNQSIEFFDNSYITDSTLATNWDWTNNGINFSNNQNPILQYSSDTLYICLTVYFDTICSSSFCDTIYTPINITIDSCIANYTYSVDSNTNQYSFQNNSYSNNTICSYLWDFGDGTSSTDINPTHIYNTIDSFNICLTIYSSNDSCNTISCTNTYCENINVDSIPPSQISISGNIYAKTALLPEGIAILSKVETGIYTAIAYTQINNGYYEFSNLNTGNYLVYAIPYFGNVEDYYPLYYPTYFGNTEHYIDAQIIFADSAETQNINLRYNENINHGFGYIAGKIVYDQGSNFETNIYNQNWFSTLKSNYEDVAQHITVLLYNSIGQVIRYQLTDENGNFEFKNIPYGTNIIYTEKAGKNTQVIYANLNQENDTVKNILIHIKETEIINVEEIPQLNADIYPIPFNNYLNIQLNENINELTISIIDITGKQIYYRDFSNLNFNNVRINTNEIKKGSYVLLIKSGNSIIFRKKIIK